MSASFSRAAALAVLLAATALVPGCIVQEPPRGEIIATAPPPPPRVEVVPEPVRPREVVVWEPGRWHWNGREYVWVAGHYIERPHRDAVYVAGHWDEHPDGRWAWVPPHWR